MHYALRAVIALILSMVAQTAGAAADPLPASAFSYDASAPLAVRINHRSESGGIVRKDVSFASPGFGRVHAEIVSPSSSGSHAGVLFVHWLGDTPKTTNLTEFEPDALALARQGVTSVLVDAMWATPGWFEHVRSTETDYQNSIAQVVALRRSLDLLLAQPGIDSGRIAYVGHDFGAMYGAVLSGVDSRPRWWILMAGTTTFSEWYLLGKKPADVAGYKARMAPLDPGQYLARSQGRAFMFQFAAHDEYITPEHELQFFESAPLPRATYVYQGGHSLSIPEALTDRLNWLIPRLRGGAR